METQTAVNEKFSGEWLDSFKSERLRLVLFPRDPGTIFAYWEWTPQKTELFRNTLPKPNITLRLFDAEDKSQAADFTLSWDILKAYLNVPAPGKSYYAELLVKTSEGNFNTVTGSNIITMPAGKPENCESPPSSRERMKKQ